MFEISVQYIYIYTFCMGGTLGDESRKFVLCERKKLIKNKYNQNFKTSTNRFLDTGLKALGKRWRLLSKVSQGDRKSK